jgi:hypothetical protein
MFRGCLTAWTQVVGKFARVVRSMTTSQGPMVKETKTSSAFSAQPKFRPGPCGTTRAAVFGAQPAVCAVRQSTPVASLRITGKFLVASENSNLNHRLKNI